MKIQGQLPQSEAPGSQLPHSEAPRRGTTFLRSCFNGINALSGVGIISIPYALSEGGWLSLFLLLLVAILCWYTGLLLKRCMDTNPLIKSYPDIGEVAFGCKGRALISIFMCVELYLVAIEFLILAGDNLNQVFPDMAFKVGVLKVAGKQGFVLLSALVILPTTWLRNLGVLAYFSAGGVLASIFVTVCVLWTGAVDGLGFHEKGVVLKLGGLPTAMSLLVFCYCGHAVFPTICNSMKDRSQFSKVLLVCFICSTINYGSMGIIGYMMYGQNVKSQVTLNLPIKKISSKLAIYTTLVNPLTKYAIIITPLATTIEGCFSFGNRQFISILIRTTIVVSTAIVACLVPFFGYVMAFTGAFLSVTISILLPCVFYLKINKTARSFGIGLVTIGGILVTGPFIAILGTYISVKQIVNHL